MMTLSFKKLLVISRPRFWLYELGTFAIGGLAAALTQDQMLSLAVLVFGFFFLFPANLFIYGVNDVFDYETDIRNPKKTGYEQVLPKAFHAKLLIIILILCIPFSLYGLTLSLPAVLSLAAFFFFAGFYSAPPIRAKARPFFDSVFSAGHYVATGVFGYFLLGGMESIWLLVSASMAWAIAMHAYSAVPDIEADSEAGLETIATTLGATNTIWLCLPLYTFAAVIAYSYIGLVAVVFYLPYLYMMIRSINAPKDALFKLYTYFPTINALVGMGIFFSVLAGKGWL